MGHTKPGGRLAVAYKLYSQAGHSLLSHLHTFDAAPSVWITLLAFSLHGGSLTLPGGANCPLFHISTALREYSWYAPTTVDLNYFVSSNVYSFLFPCTEPARSRCSRHVCREGKRKSIKHPKWCYPGPLEPKKQRSNSNL